MSAFLVLSIKSTAALNWKLKFGNTEERAEKIVVYTKVVRIYILECLQESGRSEDKLKEIVVRESHCFLTICLYTYTVKTQCMFTHMFESHSSRALIYQLALRYAPKAFSVVPLNFDEQVIPQNKANVPFRLILVISVVFLIVEEVLSVNCQHFRKSASHKLYLKAISILTTILFSRDSIYLPL